MDAAIIAALATRRPIAFYAIKIVASGITLRLLDGPGACTCASLT